MIDEKKLINRLKIMIEETQSAVGAETNAEYYGIIDGLNEAICEAEELAKDPGAEPKLEEKIGFRHELHSDGHGEFKSTQYLDWQCPECGWFVGELYCGFGKWHVQRTTSYCARCGQKIDWTKPKDEEKRRYEERKREEREQHLKEKGKKLDNMHERLREKYKEVGHEE